MKERALVPAETEFSFNQNSGRVVRVEIMCCGAGGLGLYRAEEGTLGMEDDICSLFSCSFKVELMMEVGMLAFLPEASQS